jgi:hypothetical protein
MPRGSRLTAGLVIAGLMGVWWVAFFALYAFLLRLFVGESVGSYLPWLAGAAPTIVFTGLALGALFTTALYVFRPSTIPQRLSGRRAGLVGAVSTVAAFTVLELLVLPGLLDPFPLQVIWNPLLMGWFGFVAGLNLQRTAYPERLVAGPGTQERLAP